MNTRRARPRWARIIRNFGEDLAWALRGWALVPPRILRLLQAIVVALVAWALGAARLVDLAEQALGLD